MYDQPPDPDQIVYAVYLVKPDGSLYPKTWFELEQVANNRAELMTKLSRTPHAVKPMRCNDFLQELRVCS